MTQDVHREDEIMTVSEVARYLKISEVTTYKFVQEGKIPGFKVGRHWRVKRSDLAEFIEKQKIGERI
ncbi:DNA binding domain-containing protein, excisionase family [Anaerovirgula multivorans]|uniref:DNA binding domain-containing protein, excisionase family n=1 Tax=Anaerovirgula multivorans TaxID=312168 RepID=A0A239BIH2_9FIRM|nr:helix-turn-helix domain-containing protein [Anaerovirgula multivorans]SNS06914.1 DNA binding domain-containing protein, excisionase family [Anaerovirgula multivorans]